jgi:NAD(P)-dependent dehydrogenase (short-subunit alcohol dehydrogenase family)
VYVSSLEQNSHEATATAGIAGPLLAGYTVILTGAAGGIGRYASRVLVDAGAAAVLLDRPGESLDALSDSLRGTSANVVATDLTDRASVEQLVADVVRDWDKIDDDSWQRVIDANLKSAFLCCQAVLPGMVERGSGSVVNFASTAGEYGSISPAAHYAAAKAGVIGLTKSLAREVSPHGVRVNAISPGPTDTVALGAATAEMKAKVGARTLLGRLAQPDELAHAVLYLVGPLSTFVTGHVLRVNGGSLL